LQIRFLREPLVLEVNEPPSSRTAVRSPTAAREGVKGSGSPRHLPKRVPTISLPSGWSRRCKCAGRNEGRTCSFGFGSRLPTAILWNGSFTSHPHNQDRTSSRQSSLPQSVSAPLDPRSLSGPQIGGQRRYREARNVSEIVGGQAVFGLAIRLPATKSRNARVLRASRRCPI